MELWAQYMEPWTQYNELWTQYIELKNNNNANVFYQGLRTYLINALHKIKTTFAILVYGHMLTYYQHIKEPNIDFVALNYSH